MIEALGVKLSIMIGIAPREWYRRVAARYREGGDISCNDASSLDNRAVAYSDRAENRHA